MKVAGLDLSLRATGVATPIGTLHTIKPGTRREGKRLDHLVLGILSYIEPVELAVIEGYAQGGHMRSLLPLAELGGAVKRELHRRQISYVVIPPSVVKKVATGHGNAGKEAVFNAATLHVKPADFDQADAFWLRQIGLAQAKQPCRIAKERVLYAREQAEKAGLVTNPRLVV